MACPIPYGGHTKKKEETTGVKHNGLPEGGRKKPRSNCPVRMSVESEVK